MSDPHEPADEPTAERPTDFIRDIVAADQRSGAHGGRVVTRFPPEPNGYLHIGHAKAIALDFGIAAEFGGRCHLRFDDTNPEKEETAYVVGIQRDIRWLGFDWGEHLYFASDYFERMYAAAVTLIEKGSAYVDSLTGEQIREYRGSISEPGRDSPHRTRSAAENLDLFARMRAGEFTDGAHVLRAKIDMASPHMILRDPPLYRIRHAHHHRTGDAWCIYPMYDFAHCLEDAFEAVTHSFCTLEFENNRALYDWVLEEVGTQNRPRQYEFARLALGGTLMSKRKLRFLVENGHVAGWDDPRMPTLSGFRRRGVPPEAIRAFCELVGVAKSNSLVDVGKLDYCIRSDLNHRAPRVMCVLRPLEVVLTNYPEDLVEELDASYWPHDVPREGTRKVPFSRVLYVERDDFRENPSRKWHRLAPGAEVRLRYGYVIRCEDVERDPETGEVVRLLCTYDPATRGGTVAGRKVRGTIHWVTQAESLPCEVRLYDRLFSVERPGSGEVDLVDELNPDSLVTLTGSRIEPSVGNEAPGSRYQFERQGYFASDPEDSAPGKLVFNRIVTLRDSWAKVDPRRDAEAGERRRAERAAQSAASAQSGPSAEREAARAASPELAARFGRYRDEYGLDEGTADTLSGNLEIAAFFDGVVASGAPASSAAKWVVNEVLRELKERAVAELPFDASDLAGLVSLVESGRISPTAGKEVFAEMAKTGGSANEIVAQRGLEQVSDESALAESVAAVVSAHPDEAARYRDGKTQLLGFFVGKAMKATGGRANPKLVRELLQQALA